MRAKRPLIENTPVAATSRPVDTATRTRPVVDCYCGLGAACECFRLMTPEERAACTRDKRAVAQSFYRNGLSA
jgi:hypothetical protein